MAERATKIDLSTVTLTNLMDAKYRLSSAADEMYAGAYLRAVPDGRKVLLNNAAENIAEALDALGLVAVPKAEAATDPLRDAAPDLLALLESFLADAEDEASIFDCDQRRLKAARAAIAKAKGGEDV